MFSRSLAYKVILFSLILCIWGWFVIPKLSLKLNPSQQNASVNISYTWPYASPRNIENQITAPVESTLSTLQGIKNINSRSSQGFAYISIELDQYTNVQQFRFEASTLLRQIKQQLPQDVYYPNIRINSPDDELNQQAFLSYSIEANDTPKQIKTYAENFINPILASLQGIDRVSVMGIEDREWVLRLDYDQLDILNINTNTILTAVQNYFKRENLGFATYQNQMLNVVLSSPNTVSWHIPVAKVAQRIIYLDDIAQINQQTQSPTRFYRVNGKNAISLQIYAQDNANTLALAQKVKQKIAGLNQNLPQTYSLTKIYDNTEYIAKELDKIYERTLYTILILLVFVFIISRNLRYVFHIIIGLIANISIAFGLYYLFGVEIQLYSLAGITISLGLIIDNLIVVLDHLKSQGKQNVFVAVLASTLTSIAALSVIFLLDEATRFNLIDFAYVIMINLATSLLVAFLLIPALLKFWPLKAKNNQEKKWLTKFYTHYYRFIKFLVRYKKVCIVVIIWAIGIPTFMLPSSLENDSKWYEKLYNNTYGNEWFQDNIRPVMDKAIGGSFRLFSIYVFESAYYNRNEETQLVVNGAMEKGASIEQMNEVFLRLENFLLQFPEIKQFTSNIYSSQYASLNITFNKEYENSSFPYVLKSKLTVKAIDLSGMSWNIYGVGKGFSNNNNYLQSTNFRLTAKGYNYDELNAWADTLSNMLLEHPRIQEVFVRENSQWRKKPAYEYKIDLNKQQLTLRNSNSLQTYNNLKNLSLSLSPNTYAYVGGRYEPIRLENEQSQNFDIWQIKNEPIKNLSDKPFKLKDIARIEKVPTEENIYKENQEYLRVVEFQYTGSQKFGNLYLDKCLKELNQKLPLGFSFKKSNYSFLLNKQAKDYSLLLLLVVLFIYIITSSLFESFTQPFIILSVIPISFIGVFLVFYLFDFNFDQGGMASFLLLSGITVNSSIYLINAYNVYQKAEKDNFKNYMFAFKSKIFPIMLTILSTILGFIPFVKDGQNEVFWFALGVGTISGLIFSILAIVIFLPCFLIPKKTK